MYAMRLFARMCSRVSISKASISLVYYLSSLIPFVGWST